MGLGIPRGLGHTLWDWAGPSHLYSTCNMGRKVSFMSGLIFNRDLPQQGGNSFQCLRKRRSHSALFTVRSGLYWQAFCTIWLKMQALLVRLICPRVVWWHKYCKCGKSISGDESSRCELASCPCDFLRRLDSIFKPAFKSPNGPIHGVFLECRNAKFKV